MGNPVVHFEIMSGDAEGAGKFYGELFGWHVEVVPEMNYGLVDTHAGDGINGGIGTPPDGSTFTTIYVETDDLQAKLDQAEKLGAKTAMPVTDMGMVTVAMFIDPQGNLIGLVKSGPDAQEQGGVSSGSNAPVTWFEILGTDGKALRDFYAKLFDWHISASAESSIDYGEVDTHGGRGIGGGIGASPMGKGAVTIYAQVEDLDKTLEHAETLGGKTVVQPMDVSTISFAQFADPQGNVFGIFKMR